MPLNQIVRMTFTGYGPEGFPAFTFVYQDTNPFALLKPHDHSDNWNGGLSFACFHPATSLPQQPWAI